MRGFQEVRTAADKTEESRVYTQGYRIREMQEEGQSRASSGKFGICWNCVHLRYHRTRYGREISVCEASVDSIVPLNESDPIQECSRHMNRFEMSLNVMWSIATMIDPTRRKVGF